MGAQMSVRKPTNLEGVLPVTEGLIASVCNEFHRNVDFEVGSRKSVLGDFVTVCSVQMFKEITGLHGKVYASLKLMSKISRATGCSTLPTLLILKAEMNC